MLAAALVALLLAFVVVACGGSDSDSTTGTAGQQSQAESADQADQDDQNGQNGDERSGGGSGAEDIAGGNADDFVPKEHDDSGGGSKQFKVKGGDNSVQEFGEEAAAEEFEAAAAALHNFLDARAEGNWEAACQYMSEAVVDSFEELAQSKQLEGAGCGAIVEGLTNPAARTSMKEEARKADVGSLRIEGERAFLIYTGIEGTVMAMPMADEGGEWKVAGAAGTPLS